MPNMRQVPPMWNKKDLTDKQITAIESTLQKCMTARQQDADLEDALSLNNDTCIELYVAIHLKEDGTLFVMVDGW